MLQVQPGRSEPQHLVGLGYLSMYSNQCCPFEHALQIYLPVESLKSLIIISTVCPLFERLYVYPGIKYTKSAFNARANSQLHGKNDRKQKCRVNFLPLKLSSQRLVLQPSNPPS